MFASDMNPVRDSGRVTTAGMVLFPIQFTWPHGGRSVFISGSFNRWAELVPMSQVEGAPNYFQAVCAVSHGCHEYKFLVDGEWRHDERQPHKNGEYGIVNTFDAQPVPAQTPQLQPRLDVPNNMDVDTGLVHRVSAVTLNQAMPMPRISEEDVQACRYRISVFLAAHTAYELLPESGKVVALDVDLPVKQAFHILSEQGIALAPLWDFSKGKFVGVLSALDFILILRELGNHGSNLTEEELETHTISAWKEGKAYMNRQVDGHGRPIPKHLFYAGSCDNLKDVAFKILQSGVAIVPVIHSSSEDGSFPQLLHLASLSGILKCLCRYFKHCSGSLPILQLPIDAIPLGTWVPRIGESSSRPFAMLRPTAPLSSALNMLVQAQVSSIPIVDDNDSLLDIYSRSDITALAKGRAYTHNLNEMTVYQALQLGQDSNTPYETRSQRCQMCLRTDTLLKVMEQLAIPGVRRLVIVEAGSNRVEGIVSLTDVFRFLLG
ncbi:homolog of yeast sucrose nonfermenting 4 [Hibiscus trionum]|uniref:Homolog of yeast sucrose nonfermenting 4 n=1 Tax=Hibiscus trionum TaxID=183268 RepID=A0A9W7HMH1_HIBTR|nr:homolog of yeast sucrose nonfermenting 4 [Hibiscus trionum]